MKRLKVFTSHTGHSQYCAEASHCLGYIERPDIPSPYAYSPSKPVFDWRGKPTICCETRHRRFEVFLVPPCTKIYQTDKAASDAYTGRLSAASDAYMARLYTDN